MSGRICEFPGCEKPPANRHNARFCCARHRVLVKSKRTYARKKHLLTAYYRQRRKLLQAHPELKGKKRELTERSYKISEKEKAKRRIRAAKWASENKERRKANWRRQVLSGRNAAHLRKRNEMYNTLRLLARMEQVTVVLEKAIMELPQKERAELDTVRAEMQALDTVTLKQILAQGMRLTRDWFLRMGAALVELEARGEDPQIDSYMDKLLRRIGEGKLLVDAVVRFAGSPVTLASVKALSIEEQLKVMQEDNATVAARFHPGGRSRRSPKQPAMPDLMPLVKQALNATAKDLAEMIVDMVQAHPEPDRVVEELLPRLQRLKNRPMLASGIGR